MNAARPRRQVRHDGRVDRATSPPSPHPELLALARHADGRRRAYADSGDIRLLDAAIKAWQAVLTHPLIDGADARFMAAARTESGTARLLRAQHNDDRADLDEAVSLLERATDEAPHGAPRWRASINLVAALRERAAPDDLIRAADAAREVAGQTRSGPLDLHAMAATTLGHVESDRFAADADPAHLDAAETAYRAALTATDPQSARRAARMCHLATVGIERWRLDGDPENLAGAVGLLEHAVAAANGSPSQLIALTDLGVALGELFDATGDPGHLDRAIALLDAVDAVDPGREAWNRSVLLRRRTELLGDTTDSHTPEAMAIADSGPQHAAALLDQHDRDGGPPLLDAAIAAAARAVATAGAAHRASALVNWGAALSARYAATGDVADLEQAVTVYRDAVAATPQRAPRRATRLADLADAVRERAHRLGSVTDLDEAVDLLVAAEGLEGADAPGRPHREAALALALLDRGRRTRAHRAADLPAALDLASRAVAHTPARAPDRPARLGLYAACLHERWRDSGRHELLDRAVALHRESLAELAERSPLRFRHQQNLADAVADRAALSGDPDERAEAATLFRKVVTAAADRDPWAAVSAARNWGAAASTWQDWVQAAQAYLRGLALLWRLVQSQQVRRHQEGWLRDSRQLPAGAAYALVRTGHLADAVAALDAGRAVLLAGTVHDRPSGRSPQ